MSNPDGSMTPAELEASRAKRDRERPEYDRLTQRYRAACFWLESNFDSLTYWRRFVEGVEQIILQFRREEHTLPPFAGRAFMRALCAEDPVLWADTISCATRSTENQS
jgi:hypothetical protein